MDTYTINTYSLYTNTKDLIFKNGICTYSTLTKLQYNYYPR